MSVLYPIPATHTELAQAELADFLAPDPTLVRLEYVKTKVSGTHILEIHPDRRIRQFGVLWSKEEEKQS